MMSKVIFLVIFSSLLVVQSCNNQSPNELPKPEPKLLFSSGFEEDVHISSTIVEDSEDYRFIEGTDAVTGFSWPITIFGSSESALHFVDDENHKATESEIQTTVGHKGNSTKALYNIEHYRIDATQCPYEILNITEGRKDLYIKYWIKIDSSSITKPNMWRTFFEWKTKDYAEGTGFRLISFIYADKNGTPYWHWQGDANPSNAIWEIDNTNIPVPTNEWFLTEFYWHWSDGDDGRALWKINGKVVGDHYGATTRNSKPIDFIMLTQIYGNSTPKYQWIDDIEIWDGLPK